MFIWGGGGKRKVGGKRKSEREKNAEGVTKSEGVEKLEGVKKTGKEKEEGETEEGEEKETNLIGRPESEDENDEAFVSTIGFPTSQRPCEARRTIDGWPPMPMSLPSFHRRS